MIPFALLAASATESTSGTALAVIDLLTVIVLAIFVGIELISRVPPTLHTPLMSATNAIHGVILVGAMLVLGHARTPFEIAIGVAAVVFATLNVVGGYAVTDRMLEMFKPRERTRRSGS